MSKKPIYFACALAVVCLLPNLGFADETGKDLFSDLRPEMSTLRKTLFGVPMYAATIISGAKAAMYSYSKDAITPLMIWGLVATLVFFMPTILDIMQSFRK